ncbi:uncharacterized protein LOC131226609 [Magnolia sinica]|uniref:uncharacterized protein LOC131226609 n=1 Tax=Magnolia sinica TaxID=86752 RepID=UPI00265A9FDF|nr:uncharacterized protein LOC131226609 [Magnolia sinica]
MDLDLPHGFRPKNHFRMKNFYRVATATPSTNNRLLVRLPCRFLRIIARSILFALVIATFPWIVSVVRSTNTAYIPTRPQPGDDAFFLPMLFGDLSDLGLFKPDDRAVYVGEATHHRLRFLKEKDMDVISERDLVRQRSIPTATFDFMFADGFSAAGFIDRTLKNDGIVAIQMSGDPVENFRVPLNYKIVYVQQFEATVVAMRKICKADEAALHPTTSKRLLTNRRLLSISSDSRKAALNSLEDVLLEPPRTSSMRSNGYLKKTKYLPDLTGDSLDGYPRRVFIDVGLSGRGSSTMWFEQHYPKRNRDFEIYKMEIVSEGQVVSAAPPIGMSDWLRMNIKEDEYVVMKAEAEAVEEMLKSRVIYLVDELFMECKHQGQKGKNMEKSKRAYWECLALYGKLRDEGVAVHQWWG